MFKKNLRSARLFAVRSAASCSSSLHRSRPACLTEEMFALFSSTCTHAYTHAYAHAGTHAYTDVEMTQLLSSAEGPLFFSRSGHDGSQGSTGKVLRGHVFRYLMIGPDRRPSPSV